MRAQHPSATAVCRIQSATRDYYTAIGTSRAVTDKVYTISNTLSRRGRNRNELFAGMLQVFNVCIRLWVSRGQGQAKHLESFGLNFNATKPEIIFYIGILSIPM